MNLKYFKENSKKEIDNLPTKNNVRNKLPVEFQLLTYSEFDFKEIKTNNFDDIIEVITTCGIIEMKWLSVTGPHNLDTYTAIGKLFDIPVVLLQEVMARSNRSRIQESDQAICCSLKTVNTKLVRDYIESIQISFYLQKKVLISFQEKEYNLFETIKEGIRTKVGSVRKKNEDYLFHLLMDVMINNLSKILERLEEILERILTDVKKSNTPEILENIHQLKKCLLDTKRLILPLKEVLVLIINSLQSNEYSFIEGTNGIYYTKLYNKLMDVHDQIDENTVQLENATNYFFSMQNHRMNEIMKVLTVVSVMFIPLTFIAGVYGMNFNNIPDTENGFWHIIIAMAILLVAMLFYFKKRKWF